MTKVLYLGSDPSYFLKKDSHVIHCPLIRITPRASNSLSIKAVFDDLSEYTHILFTSKHAVQIFFEHACNLMADIASLHTKKLMVVGSVTKSVLEERGFCASHVAEEETQEGMIAMIRPLDLDNAYFFLPHSSLSRVLLANFFIERDVRHQACVIYDTTYARPDPLPLLDHIEEIIFTSPSTVHAFFQIFSKIPLGKKLGVRGSITEHALKAHLTEEHEVFYV
ncbi:MAG: uroporphyrinogen-III synthase [Chlamydiota bacterium]